jgi:hypothetical protein
LLFHCADVNSSDLEESRRNFADARELVDATTSVTSVEDLTVDGVASRC